MEELDRPEVVLCGRQDVVTLASNYYSSSDTNNLCGSRVVEGRVTKEFSQPWQVFPKMTLFFRFRWVSPVLELLMVTPHPPPSPPLSVAVQMKYWALGVRLRV